MALTLEQLNAATPAASRAPAGRHSTSTRPGSREAALRAAALPLAGAPEACDGARRGASAAAEQQLALIRAHPELAGKAMVSKTLTAESTNEQGKAGLTDCTPEEFAQHPAAQRRLQRQVRLSLHPGGARAARHGPARASRSSTPSSAGWTTTRDFELAECAAQHPPHRRDPAERQVRRRRPRSATRSGTGRKRWRSYSDPGFKEQGQLTVTYLTDAHRACAAQHRARTCATAASTRCDIDAVGNVVGRYRRRRSRERARRCSPARTTTPCATAASTTAGWASSCRWPACASCARQGRRLPFGFEVVGFAEEEGQRYKATFLGSGALIGHFDPAWLDQKDADGITMREAMRHAGLPATLEAIAALQRDPARLPRLRRSAHRAGPGAQRARPAAGHRHLDQRRRALFGEVIGMASHAGTTPMDRRRDAAAAVAELALFVEQRAAQDGDSVGTIGMLRSAQRLDQRGARPLPVQPGPARAQRRAARRAGGRRAGRAARPSASAAACATRSRRPCAPPPRRARPPGSSAGSSAVDSRSACRCSACPAAPATTR